MSAFCRFAWVEDLRRGVTEYPGALAYLQRLDRHRYEFPFDELGKMAKAIRRWVDVGGRQALGNLEELRETLERVTEYQEFQPRRCDWREINRRLRALSEPEVAA
jgi:hypothetical protein